MERDIQELKTLIRDFYIKEYNHLTIPFMGDYIASFDRAYRYQECQTNLMRAIEKNACKCFNSKELVLKALESNKDAVKEYIKNGILK